MKPAYAIVSLFGPIETPAADLISHCLTLSAEFLNFRGLGRSWVDQLRQEFLWGHNVPRSEV